MTVYRVYKIKSEVIRNERKNCTICYTSEMSEKNHTVYVLSSTVFTVVWISNLGTFQNGHINITSIAS